MKNRDTKNNTSLFFNGEIFPKSDREKRLEKFNRGFFFKNENHHIAVEA